MDQGRCEVNGRAEAHPIEPPAMVPHAVLGSVSRALWQVQRILHCTRLQTLEILQVSCGESLRVLGRVCFRPESILHEAQHPAAIELEPTLGRCSEPELLFQVASPGTAAFPLGPWLPWKGEWFGEAGNECRFGASRKAWNKAEQGHHPMSASMLFG